MNRSTLHSPWCFNYPADIIHRLISPIHISSISTYFSLLLLNYTIPCPLRCSVLAPPVPPPSIGWLTDSYTFLSLQLYHVFRAVKKLNLTKFNFSGCRIGFFLFFRGKEYPYLPYALMSGRSMLPVRYEVLREVTMKITVYCVMTPCNGEETYGCFRGS